MLRLGRVRRQGAAPGGRGAPAGAGKSQPAEQPGHAGDCRGPKDQPLPGGAVLGGGDVIAQIEIPMSDDISLGLLYQISFISEGLVFEKAFKNKFHKIENHLFTGKEIYYSRKKEDCYLEKEDSMETIIRKIKAFSIYGQYAKVRCKEGEYDVFNINTIENKYVNKLFEKEKNNTIILKYDNDKFLIKYLGVLIEISISKPYLLQVGQVWIESI